MSETANKTPLVLPTARGVPQAAISPFARVEAPGGPPPGSPTQPVPAVPAKAVSLETLLRTQLVMSATSPSRFERKQGLGNLGATTNYQLFWTNQTGGLVMAFFWLDFSTANGDLRISRAPTDDARVAELNSSGLLKTPGIPVPPDGRLYIRNYNPNTTVNPQMAPTYTFTAADKLNLGIFSLDDIGLGAG